MNLTREPNTRCRLAAGNDKCYIKSNALLCQSRGVTFLCDIS
nr:MAG TPA: hypothetical protein [Caudoviricetes sp.]